MRLTFLYICVSKLASAFPPEADPLWQNASESQALSLRYPTIRL